MRTRRFGLREEVAKPGQTHRITGRPGVERKRNIEWPAFAFAKSWIPRRQGPRCLAEKRSSDQTREPGFGTRRESVVHQERKALLRRRGRFRGKAGLCR